MVLREGRRIQITYISIKKTAAKYGGGWMCWNMNGSASHIRRRRGRDEEGEEGEEEEYTPALVASHTHINNTSNQPINPRNNPCES
jgi:hypothetical protein